MKYFIKILLIIISLSQTVELSAQHSPYFLNRNLLKALSNQTRTLNGQPGRLYWQNRANYQIDAAFDPVKNTVSGSATIWYFNESLDTLDQMVLNLYQDIFRKGNSRDWDLGLEGVNEGTRIELLKVNGRSYTKNKDWYARGTKAVVSLHEDLLPSDSMKLEVKWEIEIPVKRPVRMGKYSDSSYFIAYWYPQVAVYDDIDGWDMINYHGSVEFYSDFGHYDVKITAPKDWIIWATGILNNKSAIFSKEINERIEQAQRADIQTRIIHVEDYKKGNVFAGNQTNTYHFTADYVPDFTFAAARGFYWDEVGLTVDSLHDKRIFIQSVYPPTSLHGPEGISDARQSIDYMSRFEPGLAFPYPKMTVFINGRKSGGMESPMMANNGDEDDPARAFGLAFHEIAHTYMPFYMGTNEKKYAWMDEGWASIWPQVMSDSLFPDRQYLQYLVDRYQKGAGQENDVPLITPSYLVGADYESLRMSSYNRSSMAYAFLQDALGPQTFKKALHYYMVNWAGKHPIPSDFFGAFETASDQNLDWFFKPWFFDLAYADLAVVKLTKDNKIVVDNIGGLPMPVCLEVTYTDGTKQSICEPTSIWRHNAKTVVIAFDQQKPIREVILGSEIIPDVNPSNNRLIIMD